MINLYMCVCLCVCVCVCERERERERERDAPLYKTMYWSTYHMSWWMFRTHCWSSFRLEVVEKACNKIVYVMGENQPAKPSVKISTHHFSASIYPMKFQKSIHNGKEKVRFFVLNFCFVDWIIHFFEVLSIFTRWTEHAMGCYSPFKKWLNTID